MKEIASILICGREIIMGGDFNCIIAQEDRKSITTIKLDSSSIDLMNIIKDYKLKYIFRVQNPNIPGFTWSNGSSFSRIDFVFSSPTTEVVESSLRPVFFSDHFKVDCLVKINGNSTKGLGLWKLNINWLKNYTVVSKITGKFNQWKSLQELYSSVGDWWEDLKTRIRRFLIQESKKATSKSNLHLKKWQTNLQILYSMVYFGFDVVEDIAKLKKEITKIMAHMSKSYIIRSRVQHMESNEECTRYFFRKLTGSASLDSLKIQEDQIITGTPNIVSHVH